jgi:hypothetical protein
MAARYSAGCAGFGNGCLDSGLQATSPGDRGGGREVALRHGYAAAFCAYIAASIFPLKFEMSKMVEVLSDKFPHMRHMQPRGRANVVSGLMQTKPSLIEKMHGRFYRWNDELRSYSAQQALEEVIRTRFAQEIPSKELIDDFSRQPQF